jgi:hypothetical protein
MESLQAFFSEYGSSDIHALARYIQRHVDEQWEVVFQNNRAEMAARYDELGDGVYGLYGAQLFQPVHAQLKRAGWRAMPRLPFGNFSISREWGPEDDRQRWFWSKIASRESAAIGTIVVVFFHDHVQIRIPRPPQILALEETSRGKVIQALSRQSADFKDALEMRVEIAQHLAGANDSATTP